jgi:hypothetical protein
MSNETKRCPKCERDLPTEDFNKRANGRCYAYCKACQSLYLRNHYVKNAAAYNERRLLSSRRYRSRNRAYLIEYLRTHSCVDCGESDPVVLDFDHIDPASKEDEVSNLARRAYGLDRLKLEISRCTVRCACCHRRRTAKEFGWMAS